MRARNRHLTIQRYVIHNGLLRVVMQHLTLYHVLHALTIAELRHLYLSSAESNGERCGRRRMQGKADIEVLQAAAGAKCRHAQAFSLKIASLWTVRESISHSLHCQAVWRQKWSVKLSVVNK